jgi:hypothetical protein
MAGVPMSNQSKQHSMTCDTVFIAGLLSYKNIPDYRNYLSSNTAHRLLNVVCQFEDQAEIIPMHFMAGVVAYLVPMLKLQFPQLAKLAETSADATSLAEQAVALCGETVDVQAVPVTAEAFNLRLMCTTNPDCYDDLLPKTVNTEKCEAKAFDTRLVCALLIGDTDIFTKCQRILIREVNPLLKHICSMFLFKDSFPFTTDKIKDVVLHYAQEELKSQYPQLLEWQQQFATDEEFAKFAEEILGSCILVRPILQQPSHREFLFATQLHHTDVVLGLAKSYAQTLGVD